MLTEDRVRELQENLQPLTTFADKKLVQRPEKWGPIHFEQASDDIESVISIATDLLGLPLKHLTEASAQDLLNHIPSVLQCLQAIDQFSIENIDHPANRRDQICNQLHGSAEQLQNVAYRFVPYLAYRHGDIAENRERVQKIAIEAESLLKQTKNQAEAQENEIQGIVRKAREAAASAGVATFTAEFEAEAEQLETRSKTWLKIAAALGVLTVIAAIGSYFWPSVSSNAGAWETVRNVGSKAATLAVLFTSAVWCGRIYRALMHQATVNKHRAMSLKTFQAFVKATDTEEVRDAVLLAATNAAFGNVPTGLVEHSAVESPTFTATEISKKSARRAMQVGSAGSE